MVILSLITLNICITVTCLVVTACVSASLKTLKEELIKVEQQTGIYKQSHPQPKPKKMQRLMEEINSRNSNSTRQSYLEMKSSKF